MAVCPLAVDWGNVADWAAVVIGVGAAVATTFVAVLAHRTSKRATQIAEEATTIADQQHREAVALRHGTAGILRSLLAVEMAFLPPKLAATLHTMRKVDAPDAGLIADAKDLRWVLAELQASLMPTAEGVQDKLHNFEKEIGNEIAALIGQGRAISDLCRRFESRVLWEDHGPEVILSREGRDHFVAIRNDVRRMLKASLEAAPFFSPLVKNMPGSYDEIVRLAESDD